MDWSDNISCIKCDKGGNMLVCSEDGCPIAVHAECLGCPARFDDASRFYCPYCRYRKAVAESRKARELALARKKALLIFMNEDGVSSEKHSVEIKICEDKRHNQSKTSDANVNSTCGNGRSKSNNAVILYHPFQLDGEKIGNAEEDPEASAGSKGQDPSVSNRMQDEVQEEETSAEEEQIQEEEHKNSVEKEKTLEEEHGTSVEKEKIQEEEHEPSVEKEKIQKGECEMSSASTDQDPSLTVHARDRRRFKRSKPVDIDSDTDPVQSKLLKQHGKKNTISPLTVNPTRISLRKLPSALETGKVVMEELCSSRRFERDVKPPAKLPSNMFGNIKRKRLPWTEEEEEAIRAGVERFTNEGHEYLPWKDILDMFRHKFDSTRTPVDLKDKWRNMSRR